MQIRAFFSYVIDFNVYKYDINMKITNFTSQNMDLNVFLKFSTCTRMLLEIKQ